MKYKKHDGGKKQAFPKTPLRSGDCVIRAIALATQKPYKEVWTEMFELAKNEGNFPNSEQISVMYLKQLGWTEHKLPKKPLVRINSSKLFHLTKSNKWVIFHVRHHWVACKQNTLYDTWDSRTNSWGDYQRVFRYYTKD